MSISGRGVTLKDVAARCGVAANTVSLALRGSPLVADATRARIARAAGEMGYIPNASAGSLRNGRSRCVALIFGDLANLLFSIKIRRLEEAFRKRGYQVLIFSTGEDGDREFEAARLAVGRNADGVVICPCQKGRRALTLLREQSVPCVLAGRCFPGDEDDCVTWDDLAGGRLAGNHLADIGCKRMMMLNADTPVSSAILRRKGFEEALAVRGLRCEIRAVSPSGGGIAAAVREAYAQAGPFDGIFAFSDLIALEAACCLQEMGLSVPGDVRIMGFDDILSHVMIPFPLTSVGADVALEAETIAELLISRMANPGTPSIRRAMDVKLVARGSTVIK